MGQSIDGVNACDELVASVLGWLRLPARFATEHEQDDRARKGLFRLRLLIAVEGARRERFLEERYCAFGYRCCFARGAFGERCVGHGDEPGPRGEKVVCLFVVVGDLKQGQMRRFLIADQHLDRSGDFKVSRSALVRVAFVAVVEQLLHDAGLEGVDVRVFRPPVLGFCRCDHPAVSFEPPQGVVDLTLLPLEHLRN